MGPAVAIEGRAFIVSVTLEDEEAHGLLLIVHIRTVTPGVKPVTVVFLTKGLVMVPLPEIKVHNPVPALGAFPAKVAVAVPVVAQRVWFGPAFEIEGAARPTITILSCDAVHGGLVILHLKVLLPTPNPVITEVGLFGETIVPLPPINVQIPVPAVGVLAAIVALDVTQTV